MSPFRKNVMVGVTVLGALVLFGGMLLKFGAAPAKFFGGAKIAVHLAAARADGLSPGSSVNYLGVNVGQVSTIRRAPDERSVVIDVAINATDPPPANVEGRIRTQLVGGGSSVSLEIPEGQSPQGNLKEGAQVPTVFLGNDLLPTEFGQLATELKLTTKQLRESHLVDHLDEAIRTINTELTKAGKLIESIDNTVNDKSTQENLKASLANVREATERANHVGANLEKFSANLDKMGQNFNSLTENANATITKTQGHIDATAQALNDRLLQVAKLLEQFQSIANKIDQGKGTAGMFVNDPRLYENLADTSKELNLTLKEIKLLVEQTRDEGFFLHLSGGGKK